MTFNVCPITGRCSTLSITQTQLTTFFPHQPLSSKQPRQPSHRTGSMLPTALTSSQKLSAHRNRKHIISSALVTHCVGARAHQFRFFSARFVQSPQNTGEIQMNAGTLAQAEMSVCLAELSLPAAGANFHTTSRRHPTRNCARRWTTQEIERGTT